MMGNHSGWLIFFSNLPGNLGILQSFFSNVRSGNIADNLRHMLEQYPLSKEC